MKIQKKLLILVLCAAMILTLDAFEIIIPALAAPIEKEQKIYSQATIEDEFADNSVIVVLKNEASQLERGDS